MWIKRLIINENSTVPKWKIIPNMYLSKVGGSNCIRSNFKVAGSVKGLPSFYVSCLNSWSLYTSKEPTTVEEITIQPLWNNSKVLVSKKSVYYKRLQDIGINSVRSLFNNDGTNKQLRDYIDIQSDEYAQLYIFWMSITSAVPFTRKCQIKSNVNNRSECEYDVNAD